MTSEVAFVPRKFARYLRACGVTGDADVKRLCATVTQSLTRGYGELDDSRLLRLAAHVAAFHAGLRRIEAGGGESLESDEELVLEAVLEHLNGECVS